MRVDGTVQRRRAARAREPFGGGLRAVACVSLGLAAASCSDDFDATRHPDPPMSGTFGEIFYSEACQRMTYVGELEQQAAGKRSTVDVSGEKYRAMCLQNAAAPSDTPPPAKALQRERSVLVGAVDAILPKSFLDTVQAFLVSIEPLDDDGTMGDVIQRAAGLMASMRDDKDFTAALARLGARKGYEPPTAATGIAPAIARYGSLDDVLTTSLDLLGDGGAGHPQLEALLDAVGHEMAYAAPVADPLDPERTPALARDLLFRTHPDFADGTQRLLTVRDGRGLAKLAGPVADPFVDSDGDGLPDVDASGHFVGANGQAIAPGTPFPVAGSPDKATRDGDGRLLDGSGQPVFAAIDLDPTMLHGLVAEARPLMNAQRDTALGLAYGAGALLGPRTAATKSYGKSSLSYQGFDTSQSALLDLAHAFFQILGDPNANDTLTVAQQLLGAHEDATSRVVGAMLDASDRGKAHPEAKVPATSDLYDDLVPIIVRILRVPGLLPDLLDAMEDPHTAGLAWNLATQMNYRDQFTLDQQFQTVNGQWKTPVDHTIPDADYDRSVFQRMAHLVHDANGLEFCNKDHASVNIGGLIDIGDFARCDMFRVPDLGLFFVLAIADHNVTSSASAKANRYETTYSKASFREALTSSTLRAVMGDNSLTDTVLQSQTGIQGFTRFPTPQAAARSLFLDPQHQSAFMNAATDPPTCSDGDRFIDVHNGSLFAWEKPVPNNPSPFPNDSFYDAVKPLVTAFAKHDECVAYADDGTCKQAQNAAKIFVDLMSVLHVHWGTARSTYFGHSYQSTDPSAPRYSAGDGAVTYEPLTVEVMQQSDLVPATLQLVHELNRMTIDGTSSSGPARGALAATASYLFDPAATPASVTYRDGSTMAKKSDGVNPAGRVTPYYLLADAYAKKRAQLTAAPPVQAGAWRSATSALVDQFLPVTVQGGKHQFANRHFHATALVALPFVMERLAAHAKAGDVDAWAHQTLTQNLGDTLSGPTTAAALDLVARLETDPDAKQAMYGLLAYVVDPADQATFSAVLTGAADLVQSLTDDAELVPVAHQAGQAVLPAKGLVDAQLGLVKKAHALDPACPAAKGGPKGGKAGGPKCTLTQVVQDLFQLGSRQVTPASDVADVLSAVHRADPSQTGDLAATDYASIFGNVHAFLTDEQRGFPRFLAIIQHRGPASVDGGM